MSDGSSVSRDLLVDHLNDLLEIDRTGDLAPNGLQVEGAVEIRRLVTGVSACRELFEYAASVNAEAVLVHHGLFWRGDPRRLVGFRRRRVAQLIEANTNLLAYHLPLDRHRRFGNNVLAVQGLGLEQVEEFGTYDGAPIGFRGRFSSPVDTAELARRCTELFGRAPEMFGDTEPAVTSVGIISGAAQRQFHDAIDLGLDAYVTGEVSEWVMNVARETSTLYIGAGHYATEHLGVRALGEHLAEAFGIAVEFHDVPNPI